MLTGPEEQVVPFAIAEEAMSLQVAGANAPGASGAQQAWNTACSGFTSSPH